MPAVLLTLEYDGTAYAGWQRQKNALAIQQVVEEALYTLTREKIVLHASGRTDAGVHAFGQCAHFHTSCSIPPKRYAKALNSLLPEDIAVRYSIEVPADFHARYSALQKTYRYHFVESDIRRPLLRQRAWQVPGCLDVKAMHQAAQCLLGCQNFASFCASGSSVKDTIRTMNRASVERFGEAVVFEITGEGFLYNMVRILAGTLQKIGSGREARSLADILSAQNRAYAGPTAPAHALVLYAVEYDLSR